MRRTTRWRVQASALFGAERRSYKPSFYASLRRATRAAREIELSLWNVLDLEVAIDEVEKSTVDAEQAAMSERAAALPPPALHLFNADRSGARCGASQGELDALAAEDMFELASGRKCATCAASIER